MSTNNSTYSWELIEKALVEKGIDASEVKELIDESTVQYMGRGQMHPRPEGQEKLEPRAPAEKDWADKHQIQVFDPAPENKDGTEHELKVTQSPKPRETSASKPSVSFTRMRNMLNR